MPIAMGVLQPFTGTLSDRAGTRVMSLAGLVVIACGYLAMATQALTARLGDLWCGCYRWRWGWRSFTAPTTAQVMWGPLSDDRLGVASGILSMTRRWDKWPGSRFPAHSSSCA
ncbi:MAG: hypothetical protein R2854_17830 [Caldilineaceae bacterium]